MSAMIRTALTSLLCVNLVLVGARQFLTDKKDCKGADSKSSACRASSQQPNVVIFTTDDMGWGDLKAWAGDNTVIRTPTIDELVAGGVALDRYYTQTSCSPSRAAMLTGRYPIRMGLQTGVIVPLKPFGLPLSEKTMASVFKDAGYSTHLFGKWHLGFHKWEYTPTWRGYDTWFGISHGEGNHYQFTWEMMGMGPFGDLFNASRPQCGADCMQVLAQGLGNATNHGYSSTLFSDEAVKVINNQPSTTPMFMMVMYTAPHAPCDPPVAPLEGGAYSITDTQRRKYAEMVTAIDEGMGKIVQALKNRNMFDNTILVYTNDNGAPLADPNSAPKTLNGMKIGSTCEPWGTWGQDTGGTNYPLRGGKAGIYEGGVRGVSFIHWKNGLNGGRRFGGLAHITDWLPTLASAAGVGLSGTNPLDGIDLWPALRDNSASPRADALLALDGFVSDEGGCMIFNFTKICVAGSNDGGVWKQASMYQMPPEVAAKLGRSVSSVPEIAAPFSCPNGCFVDLVADPYERNPQPLNAGHAALKARFLELKAAAVPNLWEQYNFDQLAMADLQQRGHSWPYLSSSSTQISALMKLKRTKAETSALMMLNRTRARDFL